MLGLIIFGTRGISGEEGRGEFFCPKCRIKATYAHKSVRRYFTLYFIPVIPLNSLGEYVECDRCATSFKMEVLDYDPRANATAEEKQAEARFHAALRRVLARVSLLGARRETMGGGDRLDGKVDDAAIRAIAATMTQLTGRSVPRAEIEDEIAKARASQIDVADECKAMTAYLDDDGRDLVLRAVIVVASSGGGFDDAARETVLRIAHTLGVPRARFAPMIEELASPARRGGEPRAGSPG
jgi:tellurite resistance protein